MDTIEDSKPFLIQEGEMSKSETSFFGRASDDSEKNENSEMLQDAFSKDLKEETSKDSMTIAFDIQNAVIGGPSDALSQPVSKPEEVSAASMANDQVSQLRNASKMLLNASREAFEKSLQAECFERILQAEDSSDIIQFRCDRSQDLADDGSRIPKRKSGSLSEMVLATLPLKRQKSEDSDIDDIPPKNTSSDISFPTDQTLPDYENSKYSSALPSTGVSAEDISMRKNGAFKAAAAHENDASVDMNRVPPIQPDPPADILKWIATFSGWDHSKKLFALEQLLDSCECDQVRHVSAVIEPMLKRDFISLLPKELALVVLGFLKPRDLLRAAQTCQYWRIIAEDNLLWREKCQEDGLSHYLSSTSQETLRRRNNMNTSFVYSTWKAGFLKQYRTEMNLRQNPIKDPKVLKGHDDHVITCLEFFDNKIVSGSDDNTLKIWCVLTGECLRTLVGHTGGVWTSQMDGQFIISGSTDRSLKVWDVDTGSCLHTLRGHTSTVRCMHLHGGVVVSGSRDATLRMWDVREGECLHVLVGHMAAVRCVQFDGRLVISGGYDYMVKVWDPETEECLHTLVGHTNRVYSLQFDGIRTVVSGSLDTYIRVWDVVTGVCRHTLMGHQSLTSGLELQGDVLVSGNADSTVKIWNILSGNCLQTLAGPNKHGSAVTSIQFNDKFVVTSSDDGTVKLWDVKTGEFIRDLVALESGGAGGVVWRIRMKGAKIVCAVGSRNGTEETKLLVLNFDTDDVE